MPLVIRAVEAFGRQDAYHMIGASRGLPQTQESIAWIVDEVNNEESNRHENYTFNLSMVLVRAAPPLLLPRESDILNSPHFFKALSPTFTERLQMLSWGTATCWQNLEKFCEEGKDKRNANEVKLGDGQRIVEAFARSSDECDRKVDAILKQKTLVISTLIEEDSDLFNEQCANWGFRELRVFRG